MKTEIKWIPFLAMVLSGVVIWILPKPAGVEPQAWHLLALFVATIVGIISKPLPMGVVALLALAVAIVTDTLTFAEAFACFGQDVTWLIVFAFFVARGFINTGLGSRIAYLFMALLGKKTLGLGYGLVLTELVLAPAIPSTTARAGGVIFPILRSLAKAFGSDPGDGTAIKMGTFLTQVAFQATCITSAMFLTAMAGNPLIVELASEAGVSITWGGWALAALVPGLLSLIIVPLVIYKVQPPALKESAHAPDFAREKLKEMGRIKPPEWIMLFTFFLLLFLWIFGGAFGIKAATTALIGLVILLLTGVLTWKDVLKEESAWDTLIWFSALVMLACNLNKFGLTHWFSQAVVGQVDGWSWVSGFALLALLYFYTHYFFAGNVAHIGAMYPPFLLVAVTLGTPPMMAALVLGFFSSLFGGLTHYGCGPAPILFGSGYVPVGSWWRMGALVSVVNILIWLGIGGIWWKILGLW